MVHHVIYIPGLGDHKTTVQLLAPKYWQLFGIKGHNYVMHWNDQKAFAPKLAGLLALIDRLARDGSQVSLVATSAGASVALVAYAARQEVIAGVVCICGKINHPETVEAWRFQENPAFKESLARLQQVLPDLSPAKRSKVMSIRPIYDETVPIKDTVIPGARQSIILAVGHAVSIGVALIFAAPLMMSFLKRQAALQKRMN